MSIRHLPLILLLASGAAQAREPLDRPNVLLVFLDDSGYGDYAHNGNPVVETPSISRLAAEGATLTQFYVPAAACSASRYSLLTGRYPIHSGFGGWVIGPESKPHLNPAETTLAEVLKARGYATGIFGKWHLGNPNKSNGMSPDTLPLAHGFDTWLGTNVSHDYGNAQLLKSDPAGAMPIPGYAEIARNLPSHPELCESLTARSTDAAVEFIRARRDTPFFAYVPYNMPHLGLYVSAAFKGKSRRGLFGDVMAEVDASVGRLLAALEETGVTRNTLVVFTADNGPWIQFQNTASHPKYGEARLHIGYAQPFRDGKGSNWEGGHRVTGLFRWPGVIPPARQLEPASTLDVLPTVAALCGGATPAGLDGRDIRQLLAPQRFKKAPAPFELAYSGPDNRNSALRVGPWKLHTRLVCQTGDNYGFKASPETPLLFNVEEDPAERMDRAAEQPAVVARLMARFAEMAGSQPPPGKK